MTNDGDGGEAPRRDISAAGGENDENERKEETSRLLETGPKAGNRAGGLAFLALMVILAAALHFQFGGGGYPAETLDAELRRHAELSLAAHKENPNMVIVPAWPLRLYGIVRRDMMLYLAFVAAAAYLWGLSVRARARRDAYLVHENFRRELDELGQRLEKLEKGNETPHGGSGERKG